MSIPLDYKIVIQYPTILEYDSYEKVNVSEEQLKAIRFIMDTLSQGLCESLKLRKELEGKAPILAVLHPFKNLAVIVTDEELKKKYNTLYNMYGFNPIRSNFFGKFQKTLQAPVWEQTLLIPEFLDGFSREINKETDLLKKFIVEKNWDGFFREIGN